MYLGRLLYNRQRFLKNPDTAKRVPRLNPSKDWIVIDMPELRIVSDDMWWHVHQRLDAEAPCTLPPEAWTSPLALRHDSMRRLRGCNDDHW